MNPTRSQTRNLNKPNLFEGIENWNEFEKTEPENISVRHSENDKQQMRESWVSLYHLKTEDIAEVVNQSPVNRMEANKTAVSVEFSDKTFSEENPQVLDEKPVFAIENAKGSGSSLEEAGFKLDFPALGKEIGRGLFGALGIFKEIFMDTVSLIVDKKDRKAEKPETDPEKAKAKAEKKVEDQKKKNNIRAFYDRMQAQTSGIAPIDAVRMEAQEKANINITAKIGQESYKGIKDPFGRVTTYAASMFEKAKLDEDKKAKKQEKEMKIASINKGPDLNLDKVAEGGFLSSTGGQGAG